MTITVTMPARGQAQLVADHLRVVRGGRTIFDDVSMAVAPGARWGIVGENGCGKSTLLAALSGGLTPDSGTVHRFGGLGLVEQELSAAGGVTVGDVIEVQLAAVRRVIAAFESASAALASGENRALPSDVATSILDLDRSRDGRPRVYGDGFAGYRHGRRAELARWEEEFEQVRTGWR